MDKRIRFIEHKGKQVLLVDFSLATAQQMLPLLIKVQTTVAEHGPKSLLILANFEGADIDDKVAMKLKQVLAFDRPFVKKTAWLGTEYIAQSLIDNVHIFSQRETVTFKSRQKALEWLVEEQVAASQES